jgi:hypothetical protein
MIQHFIQHLAALSPSSSELKARGYSDRLVDYRLKMYNPEIRLRADNDRYSDLISELFALYDPSFIRFGDFHFLKELSLADDGLVVFCQSSGTYLGYKCATCEIEERDFDTGDTIRICAKSPEAFLEALLVLMEFYSTRLKSPDPITAELKDEFFNRIMAAAGTNEGATFWRYFIEW